MKSMKKTIWILALLIPAFTGCNDWLDVSSKTEIPSDVALQQRNGVQRCRHRRICQNVETRALWQGFDLACE